MKPPIHSSLIPKAEEEMSKTAREVELRLQSSGEVSR